MKILHTSDWHLGNRQMEHQRMNEFRQFLQWLLELMEQEQPDALLISGDIFDTTNPGETARELYCDFLSKADGTGCRHIIVTAGNHDSVAQLNVARPLLHRHHAHVITSLTTETAETCLIPITSESGDPLGLVCAVPFLRVSEVSLSVDADDEEARKHSYENGIGDVYRRVAELAEEWKKSHPDLPVIAMGHLSVQGSSPTPSTRTIIGTLDTVGHQIFAPVFDYVALGHIHKAADMDNGRIRYCGSPLAMGIDEVEYPHNIVLWENGQIRPIPVPEFTLFRRFTPGNIDELRNLPEQIQFLSQEKKIPVWALVEYTGGDQSIREINELLSEIDSQYLQHYLTTRRHLPQHSREEETGCEGLEQYTPQSLFERRLREYEQSTPLDETKRHTMLSLFNQVISEITTD